MKAYFSRLTLLLLLLLLTTQQLLSQPIITGFSPATASAGSQVIISGSGFSSVAAENKVYFGGAIAQVSAASSTNLTVTVPFGAAFAPITNTVNGLTAYSSAPFISTFASFNDTISLSSFKQTIGLSTNGPNSSTPSYPVAADFDGDGKVDIIAANSNYQQNTIFRNISAGSLRFEPAVEFSAYGTFPYAIQQGDLDGDGKPDLVITSYIEGLSLFRNISLPGAISFAPRVDLAGSVTQMDLTIGDIDGDGRPDIVVVNKDSNKIAIHRNVSSPGNFSFAPPIRVATGNSPYHMALRDMDADGKPEVLVTSNSGVSVYKNLSTPSIINFASRIDFDGGGSGDISVGDMDGDNKPDIVVANSFMGTFAVLRNTSAAGLSFAAPVQNIVSDYADWMTLGDLNGDGKLDVAFATNQNSRMKVFQNACEPGLMYFFAGQTFLNNYYTSGILINDFDADGRPEILVGSNISGSALSLYTNLIGKPQISTISPLAAGAGETITISGTNFTGTSAVNIGGKPAQSFSVINNNTINAVVANKAFTTKVSVVTAAGIGEYNNFQYRGPNITGINPAVGGQGSSIQISGYNFTGTTAVKFGGVAAAGFTVNSNTLITAAVASGNTGLVEVITPKGTDESDSTFRFYQRAVITGFTPPSAAAGATIHISGSGLATTTGVRFGNTNASSFVINSDTVISAIVGTGASGYLYVTSFGGIDSAAGFIFTGPTIRSFAPAAAHAGDTVVITGNNFSNTSSVAFGSIPASFYEVLHDTSIRAIVGIGASGIVQVTTPTGTAAKTGFIYVGEPIPFTFCPPVGSRFLTTSASGTAYQWQVNTGTGFVNISNNSNYSGVTTGILQLTSIPSSWNNYIYRCRVNGAPGVGWRVNFSNTWTGAVSNAWENPSNWSCGVVPDNFTNVVVYSGTILISSNVIIRSLTVAPGAVVTVATGFTVTITN